ncbi:effector-associated constant component EACC1 [Plantactinospora sp. CA-290183]|uniref:effector-associated constant component EACC1 n=1 Tax=Plantactinospora sp. CA-290183 TaxID=3240006 RepID=UPI003D91DECD
MTGGVLSLAVSGPVPGSVRDDAEAATALLRELHARTILQVARPGDEGTGPGRAPARAAPLDRFDLGPSQRPGPGGGPKGGGSAGAFAELVVTGLFSASTVAALAQVVVAFVQRGSARRITLRDGQRTLTISDPSEESERTIAEWLGVAPTAGPPASGPTQSGAGSGAD